MAQRSDIPVAVYEHFAKLCGDPSLTVNDIGNLIREAFPSVFDPGTRARSIYLHMQRTAEDAGVEIPRRKPGLKEGGSAPPANTNFPDEYPELLIPFENKLIVVSDVHSGVHYVKGMERACAVIDSQQIPCVVINGDFFDMGYKGHKDHRAWTEPTLTECVGAGTHFIDLMIAAGARRFVVVQGNHDDKPLRDGDQEISYEDFWKVLVEPRIERLNDAKFYVTSRYYAMMEPRSPRAWRPGGFVSDDYPWVFEHQKNYAKNQLATPAELCDIYEANIICGHAHHLAIGRNKSQKKWAIEAGTFADPQLVKYKTVRHSRHPAWGRGFVTLDHGVPSLWHFANPDEWWQGRLSI